jgi:DNA-binding NarL/FixJ family response regulator
MHDTVIAAIIQSQPNMTIVGQAGTAEGALNLYWEHRPEITLMGLGLPDKSVVEVIRAVPTGQPPRTLHRTHDL